MDRLARFTDATLTDPAVFGGGSARGHALSRSSIITYGYLGVVEEYEDPDAGARWCLLTVSLPGLAPYLVIDHRIAHGRVGVPAGEVVSVTGDDAFDDLYSIVADDDEVAAGILTPGLRALLIEHQVQRLVLRRGELGLRTFDGASASEAVIEWLDRMVEGICTCTPSFVVARSGHQVVPAGRPLGPGLYAAPDPHEDIERKPERGVLAGLIPGRARHRD